MNLNQTLLYVQKKLLKNPDIFDNNLEKDFNKMGFDQFS